MNALVLLAGVLAVVSQAHSPSARDLLNNARPLIESEIATILTRSQDAVTGKTLRLPWMNADDGGPDILMGSRGQPRVIHWAGEIEGGVVYGIGADGKTPPPTYWRGPYVTITEFTGRPAVRCRESAARGELVIEYAMSPPSNQWNVTARAHQAGEPVGGPGLAPIFEMLQARLPLSTGERRRINGRSARAFVSSWTPAQPTIAEPAPLIGDPTPNVKGEPIPRVGVQTLWIDVETVLPVRWEGSIRDLSGHGFDFKYGGRRPRPPAGVAAPDCIQHEV